MRWSAQSPARAEISYIVELAEATNEALFYPHVDSLGLPPSRR